MFYFVLFVNKFSRGEVFSGVFINLSKQTRGFDYLETIFPKSVFSFQNRKNEYHRIPHPILINLGAKFHLKMQFLIY